MSLLGSTSQAATSDELAKACDLALNAKVQEVQLCNLGVQLRQNELERTTKENAQLRESGTGLFSNPFVWMALGLVTGAFIGARATR